MTRDDKQAAFVVGALLLMGRAQLGPAKQLKNNFSQPSGVQPLVLSAFVLWKLLPMLLL